MADLNVTAEGKLAAFLAFWLSRFVLPDGSHKARNICNGRVDGFRAMNFFGPNGYIYHGLGETASRPNHLDKANAILPSHYLFPCLYHRRLDSDCPDGFPTLVRYAGLLGRKISLPQARHVFRDMRYLSLRLAPIERTTIMAEISIIDLAQANVDLQRRDTGAKFYVPPSYYEGEDWARESILKRLEAIIGIISNHGSAKDFIIKICWLSSKIEEIFGVVETAARIEELVVVDRVKALSDQDLTCSFEIVHIEGRINNLSNEASKLQVKEQEVLREEEQIRKMREDLTIQQQSLIESESKLKSSRDL
ncbi:LOW QUALITY PROTEIN: hypothetical protein Cgig2_000002 [Carnegiea gigantea]|uniref:Aminotransferase-like plant mobile domain-containing protein n=1 Tax=Carnegiea gigantea TaxID=171969 RepID=A0A9Q1JW10_9CARY|nr:LOW QUALITY PROTEIN: hypothetical protein Cgig2_000002 [Carnegiea gigantea]